MRTVWTAIVFVASFVVTLATVSGCAPLEGAKTAANAARDLAPLLDATIATACTKPAQAAKTDAERDAIKAVCLPLIASHDAFRAAHMAAVVAILAAESGGKVDAAAALSAGIALVRAIESVQAAADAAKKAGAK